MPNCVTVTASSDRSAVGDARRRFGQASPGLASASRVAKPRAVGHGPSAVREGEAYHEQAVAGFEVVLSM